MVQAAGVVTARAFDLSVPVVVAVLLEVVRASGPVEKATVGWCAGLDLAVVWTALMLVWSPLNWVLETEVSRESTSEEHLWGWGCAVVV